MDMNNPNHRKVAKYTNTLNGRIRELLKGVKRNSKIRGQEYSITYDDILNLWNNQKGLCYYTKWPMTTKTGDITLVSIERKNIDLGYTLENTVLVCWCVNRAKSTMLFEDFYRMCLAVAAEVRAH